MYVCLHVCNVYAICIFVDCVCMCVMYVGR